MITGVVLARNEERHIVECLLCLRQFVEEIILIDMESSDNTVELAQPYADKVLHHPMVRNFDAARNMAIPIARYDWMWFCDADERISLRAGDTVRDIVAKRAGDFEAISIPFKSYFCGQWVRHCGWWPGYTMPRVLKRGFFRFRDELHGGVEVRGREVRINPDPDAAIEHFSYSSVEHYFEKFNRYTTTESLQLATSGACWNWKSAAKSMIQDLWIYYEKNQGWRDGNRGWILSWLAGQYRWASHAKLIDMAEDNLTSSPANLDEFFGECVRELARLRGTPFGHTFPSLVWRSPIRDPSGYAEEGRCFLKALGVIDRCISLVPIEWSNEVSELPHHENAYFHTLAKHPISENRITITNCIPTLAGPDDGAAYNVLRTTFETDRIPQEWLKEIQRFDEVWVLSQYNYDAFVRSGVPPEKVRVVPSCIDIATYCPNGAKLQLPFDHSGSFVFLSVFDWQFRKGWDVLLRAFTRAFSASDGVLLVLKVTRNHGHPLSVIQEMASDVLSSTGVSLEDRNDIVFFDDLLSNSDMACLYRSVDAFVLPSRGEGWGRPYMEAMASGLPTIGTNESGNIDFMNERNSLLVDSKLTRVSEQAAREIPVFTDHFWLEPDEAGLVSELRRVRNDPQLRQNLGEKAVRDIQGLFSLEQGKLRVEQELQRIDGILSQRSMSDTVDGIAEAVSVELCGEFFAGHSFSNINEHLAEKLASDSGIRLTCISFGSERRDQIRDRERESRIRRALNRQGDSSPQVTIRHSYPPNWEKPVSGKWVHIQPWEFGFLPDSWISPLHDCVDEVWAPSNYVKRVYVSSGVSPERVKVIPWGIDPVVFTPTGPSKLLSTEKGFRFIYVGGTTYRKGFDLLLQAFVEEFTPDDDVCLVVKDMGRKSVYRYGNLWSELMQAVDDPHSPEILAFDDEMTPGQLAALYRACDVLVAPYRGEGFGMPILEGMACGLAPIVPRGGPTDDFVDNSTGFVISCDEVETSHPEPLCGPATEFKIELDDLKSVMRMAYEDPQLSSDRGALASQKARAFTWDRTVELMKSRLFALANDSSPDKQTSSGRLADRIYVLENKLPVTAFLEPDCNGEQLADQLSRIAPFVQELVLVTDARESSTESIAREYGARLVPSSELKHQDEPGCLLKFSNAPYLLKVKGAMLATEKDWQNLAQALSQNSPLTDQLTLPGLGEAELFVNPECGSVPPIESTHDIAMKVFQRDYYPNLGKRAVSFFKMLEHLAIHSAGERRIVETGCIRMKDDWGAGQSTLIFDSYVSHAGGQFFSVDNNKSSCVLATELCKSATTSIVHEDSIQYLRGLSKESPNSIALLYLDSFDVDWMNPHEAAMHHLLELCAAQPALKPGAMIFIDDHRNEQGRLGKSKYVIDFMHSIGAKVIHDEYQIGWII